MIEHTTQIVANGNIYTQVGHSFEKPLAMSIARSTREQSTQNIHVRALVRRECSGYAVYMSKVVRRYDTN